MTVALPRGMATGKPPPPRDRRKKERKKKNGEKAERRKEGQRWIQRTQFD